MIIGMKQRGFTITELVIAITIMAVLIVLSFLNLESSQTRSRDAERSADIETIALNLDTYYKSGIDGNSSPGKYPSTQLISNGITFTKQLLRDIDDKTLTAPGITDPVQTFTAATNNKQNIIDILPLPTINQYVYQPIQSDGSLCSLETQECRKFNLYYRTEADNVVHIVTSKNQ